MMFTFPAYALTSSTLLQLFHQLTSQSHPVNLRLMASKAWEELQIKVAQLALNISFLVEQSMDAVDAIGRTLYRQWWSHRLMLEWTTSAQVEQLMRNGRPRPKLTQQGPLFALAVSLLILLLHPSALPVALPFLCAWALSPWTKVYLSGRSSSTPTLTAEQRATFRTYARRTWHFFETFVTEADHWLAPDNFQVPKPSPPMTLQLPLLPLPATFSDLSPLSALLVCRRIPTQSSLTGRPLPTLGCSCWRRCQQPTWPSSDTASAWTCWSASSTPSATSTASMATSSTVRPLDDTPSPPTLAPHTLLAHPLPFLLSFSMCAWLHRVRAQTHSNYNPHSAPTLPSHLTPPPPLSPASICALPWFSPLFSVAVRAGTRRRRASRCCPSTSRRSIAATSPVICWW